VCDRQGAQRCPLTFKYQRNMNFVAVPRDNLSRQLILMIRATSAYLTNVVQHHSNPLDCLILPYELSTDQGQCETPALIATSPCSGCIGREQCALSTLAAVRRVRSLISQGKPAGWKHHTLEFWWSRKGMETLCRELCAPCSSACMSAYESARGDYWDKIPSAFNLPSWKELKSLREATFSE